MKVIVGGIISYFYNHFIGKLPFHELRRAYLKAYLADVGQKTSVQMNCCFLNGRKVYLGARNVINFGCVFDGRIYSIRTGKDVSIGPNATILTLSHNPQSPHFANKGGDVEIGDRVWIAYGAIILPGVTIGEGAVVGAGSVVTKDVEPYTIVAGNPARFIKYRNTELDYHLDFKPLF